MQFRNHNVEKPGAKDPILPVPQPGAQLTPERQDAVAPVAPRRGQCPLHRALVDGVQ